MQQQHWQRRWKVLKCTNGRERERVSVCVWEKKSEWEREREREREKKKRGSGRERERELFFPTEARMHFLATTHSLSCKHTHSHSHTLAHSRTHAPSVRVSLMLWAQQNELKTKLRNFFFSTESSNLWRLFWLMNSKSPMLWFRNLLLLWWCHFVIMNTWHLWWP